MPTYYLAQSRIHGQQFERWTELERKAGVWFRPKFEARPYFRYYNSL